MANQEDNPSYCSALLSVLGMYNHSDPVAGGEPVITIFFPQDTANDYPGYTLVHELTHRDLVDGSLVGDFQLLLGMSEQLEHCPLANRRRFRTVLERSVGGSRLTHEAVATYVGLIHQATTEPDGVERIYSRLPAYYRSALSMLETALPKCTDLAESVPHLYRNIVLALGKCALNTRTVEKLLNVSEPSFEALAATVQEDVPDILFQRLLKRLAEEPGILRTLLDIARRTPIEAGFASFEEFLAGAGDMPGDALANLVFTLDQRLMSQLGRTFEFIRGPGLDASERTDLINNFIGRWNAAFHERYGHTFAAVDKIEMRMTAQPRIRIMPSPSVASGERASSVTPLPMITQGDLVAGLDAAKTLGLWVHVRLFINPRDKTLSLGRTAPPLKPRCAVLVFAPCIPDSVRTGDDRLRFFELMRRNRGIPSMPTSLYIENDSLPELIRQLAKIPLLWHVDWIMYNFASAAGITVDELPGDKYIHMDNADDVTFFGVMEDLGANSKTEGYVQWFGNKTLLVATVYRVGKPIFYSIPLAEYKYSEFTGKLASIRGRFLKNNEYSTRPFGYRNNMALLFHYGV